MSDVADFFLAGMAVLMITFLLLCHLFPVLPGDDSLSRTAQRGLLRALGAQDDESDTQSDGDADGATGETIDGCTIRTALVFLTVGSFVAFWVIRWLICSWRKSRTGETFARAPLPSDVSMSSLPVTEKEPSRDVVARSNSAQTDVFSA